MLDVKTVVTSTIQAKLEWSVNKLELEQTEPRNCIRSPAFTVPVCGTDTEWFISIYPRGSRGKRQGLELWSYGELSTYLHLHHTPPSGYTGSSDTEYSMAFRTDKGLWPDDHQVCRKGTKNTNEWRKKGLDFIYMCPTESLANMYVDDLSVNSMGDTGTPVKGIVKRKLVVVVWLKIAVAEEIIRRGDEFNSDMKKIFPMKNFSDVLLKCNGHEFPCHKIVLSARSDVFKAMLENEMKEAQDNVIEIVDSTPEIVTMMVEYIYTGNLPQADKQKQLAPDFLHIAVKYNLGSLITVCEDVMVSELKPSNAIKTLIYVDRYKPTSKFREQILKFMSRNAREIVGMGDWNDFIKQYPDMATEMFQNVLENLGQGSDQTKKVKKSRIG